jgi:hypothetical protein
MDAGLRALATLSVVLLMHPSSAIAQDGRSEASTTAFALRTSVKASVLVFRTPDWPELFPERTGAESMWRLRVEPEVRSGQNVVFVLAYEQQLRYASSAAGVATVGILPSQAPAPYRLVALDWSLTASSGASWRHEIDRASAKLQVGRTDITVGRQAIGWGRGVMFGAVDLFAPFSPLEADREWRRGVDAIRTDLKVTDRSSLDILGAFGTTWDRSAVAARVRGFAGPIDVEVMGGRRAQDWFGGLTTSAAVGDAEVHGEVAAFRVPPDVFEDDSRLVWKAVVGGSYRLPIGSGILAYAEYHYSGFGAAHPGDILRMLSSPDFRERYLRGDTQILSRHALALTGSYEASPEFTYAGQWVHNPTDRSGIVAPSVTYTRSDHVSLLGTAYIPYGPGPRAQAFRSEFGTSLLSVLLQLRIYL